MRNKVCWDVQKSKGKDQYTYYCFIDDPNNRPMERRAIQSTIEDIENKIKKLTPVVNLVNELRKNLKELETLKRLIDERNYNQAMEESNNEKNN